MNPALLQKLWPECSKLGLIRAPDPATLAPPPTLAQTERERRLAEHLCVRCAAPAVVLPMSKSGEDVRYSPFCREHLSYHREVSRKNRMGAR